MMEAAESPRTTSDTHATDDDRARTRGVGVPTRKGLLMHHTPPPTQPGRTGGPPPRSLRTWVAPAVLAVLALVVTACGAKSGAADTVALDKPVPATVPADTTLTIGDPVTQVALQTSG